MKKIFIMSSVPNPLCIIPKLYEEVTVSECPPCPTDYDVLEYPFDINNHLQSFDKRYFRDLNELIPPSHELEIKEVLEGELV